MSFTNHIKQIAGSIYFENTITFVILIAGLIVGMQTFEDINLQYGTILRFIDDLVLVIFVIEILVLMIAEYPRIWRYFYEPWHIFDFTIVAICFLPIIFPESNTQFFAVFRLARILRLAKIFEKIKSLKILLVSLVSSLPSMSYIIVLLLLLFYIYGVIATDIFGKYAVDEFGTLWHSMKSLLFVAFEGVSSVYDYEGIQTMLHNGFPEWLLALFFISFLFIAAMIFLNLFIGVITSDIQSTKDDEKRGKSRISYKNHTVIIGWSDEVFKIITELIIANESRERAYITILASQDKNEMDYAIKDKIHKLKTTIIKCRNGSPTVLSDLEMMNCWYAKSIIILKDANDDNSDIVTLKTIVALTNHPSQKSKNEFHIVAEMDDKRLIKVARSIAGNTLIIFEPELFITKLIAQCALQPYLSQVHNEISGFSGSEFYIAEQSINQQLIGKQYREIIFCFNKSCPVGIIQDSKSIMNPLPDYIFQKDDKLLILAEDDSSIKFKPVNSMLIDKNKIKNRERVTSLPKNILILGSSGKLPNMVDEIISYLSATINIRIISEYDSDRELIISYFQSKFNHGYIDKFEIISQQSFSAGSAFIEFLNGDIEDKEILDNEVSNAESIILLSYYGHIEEIQNADSVTLVALIHLRNILQKVNKNTPIVAELIDNTNRELANNPKVSDFIVSSNITSPIISQIAENKKLYEIFKVLLSSDGGEFYMRRVSEYLQIDSAISFATVLESAIARKETAIGVLIFNENNQPEFVLNPSKDKIFTFGEKDKLIVIAEEI